MELTVKQKEALKYLTDNTTKYVLYGGGAGGGKSVCGCYWLMQLCYYYPNCKCFIGREEIKSSRASVLQTFYKVASDIGFTDFKVNDFGIIFENGSTIQLLDLKYRPYADPNYERFGSLEYTAGWIEECSQTHPLAFEVLKTRVGRWKNNDMVTPKIFLTCNPSKNWLYDNFYKPYIQDKEQKDCKYIPALITDNPFIQKEYIDNLYSLKDEATKQRLLYGNWDYEDNPTALIPFEKIEKLFSKEKKNDIISKYIVCDIARFGRDKTVIMVFEGYTIKEIITYKESDLNLLSTTIKSLMKKYTITKDCVLADESGVGGFLVDNIQCNGFIGNGKSVIPYYQHIKSECGYRLADCIEMFNIECEVDLDTRTIIQQELGMLRTYQADKDGKLKILPKDLIKEEIGRSPDFLDCFIMRMWYDVKPQFKGIRKIII